MLVAIDISDIDELPKSCRECPLVLWGEWHDHCAVVDKSVDEHIIDQTKPCWCPMKRVDGLIHDLYASYYYEDSELCELFHKPRVDFLGVDVSDVHW